MPSPEATADRFFDPVTAEHASQALWPLIKKSNRGFRGYPVVTVAFYGPDDRRASKVTIGLIPAERAETVILERRFSEDRDVREDADLAAAVLSFVAQHAANTVADRIIGCPHEEGIDYPEGEKCPQCPFWAPRDRWTGQVIE